MVCVPEKSRAGNCKHLVGFQRTVSLRIKTASREGDATLMKETGDRGWREVLSCKRARVQA